MGNTQISRPGIVRAIPAAVNVVQVAVVLEIGAINSELVVRVQLGFVCEFGSPEIGARAFEDEHAVVDGWTVKVAVHVDFGWWRVVARVCRKNNVPVAREIVNFRGPKVG